jgi:hypothetical protein
MTTWIRVAVALWLALLPAVSFEQTTAKNKAKPTADEGGASRPLVLKIGCEKQKIAMGDSLTLTVQIINTSSEPVRLFGELKWGYGGGLTLNIQDGKGQVVQPEQYDDDMIVPSRIALPDSYVVLLPDHIFGIVRTDTAKNLFGKQGEYRLSVRYWSPVSQSQAKRQSYFGRESGPVDSNTIDVAVL